MDIWYLQNVWILQENLNAAAEKIGLPLYSPPLDDRFLNLSQGNVIQNKSCQHAPNFNVFNPPSGTVCAWSSLLSVVSGLQDLRSIENTFDYAAFSCHTPNLDNSMDMFMAFSTLTNVSMSYEYFCSGSSMLILVKLS